MRLALPFALFMTFCGIGASVASAAQGVREEEAVAAFRKLEATCAARMEGEAVKPLEARFPLTSREQPSAAMMSSQDKPSTAERAAIRALARIADECNRMTAEVYERYVTPAHLAVFRVAAIQREMLLVRLHEGDLTYGAYNQERMRIQDELLSAMHRLHEAMEAGNTKAAEMIRLTSQQRHQAALKRQRELQDRQRSRKGAGRCEQVGAFAYCELPQ